MVDRKRGATRKKRQGKLTYFYLDGNLHRTLVINRGADSIITWCYPLEKRITYVYSYTLTHRKPAFTTREVAQMLNRAQRTLDRAIREGNVRKPQHSYGLDENKNFYKYMWCEKDIMDAHDYLCTVHRGRPRKDGVVVPQVMPSKREVRAMIRQESISYVKMGDEFVPAWRANEFD